MRRSMPTRYRRGPMLVSLISHYCIIEVNYILVIARYPSEDAQDRNGADGERRVYRVEEGLVKKTGYRETRIGI